MNCPDCRAVVTVQPSPNYLLRDLVHMFISRVEFLPEDETTAEHDEAKRIEAELIETDRTTRTSGGQGLFNGAFTRPATTPIAGPIRDEEDGVLRCPVCTWEMEDGACGQCGYTDLHGDFHDEGGEHWDTTGSLSVNSTSSDADNDQDTNFSAFLARADWREFVRRDQTALLERRAARERRRNNHQPVAPTSRYSSDSEYDDEEMAAFVERHLSADPRLDMDIAEHMDVDEEMTSVVEDEDGESTTSFHRAAILARDRGLDTVSETDGSTSVSDDEGEGETVADSNSVSNVSTVPNDSDTPEPTTAIQRLASRPARIVIDSEDESSDSSNDEREEDEDDDDKDNDDDEEAEESSYDESTPSPPRPAAVRRARIQMHRVRRGGRGRGRPRTRD